MTLNAIFLGLLLTELSFSQKQTDALPGCPQQKPPPYWNNCIGVLGAKKDTLVGEFHYGKVNGMGVRKWPDGLEYVGEYRDGEINGQGTINFPNGTKYVGEFHDGALNGKGTFKQANGTKYVGEFHDGKYNGQGTYTSADGTNYVGEFHENEFDGWGTYTLANGNKYVGEFHAGTYNGQGTYTYANGAQKVGLFKDGKYTAPAPTLDVHLDSQGGVLVVPVLINEKLALEFVIDSGAADVSIPDDVVLALMRTGTLTEADFTGTSTYVLADGSKMPSRTFRIKSLRVGERVLGNVSGSTAPANSELLLGQSFLSRFTSWAIDNSRQMLVLK